MGTLILVQTVLMRVLSMMQLIDFVKKLRKIEFHTRKQTREAIAGSYHSAFKGRGMSFSECKPYEDGDDVRYIDWNASARQQGLFVKQFVEERELNVCIVLDLSPSMAFASTGISKQEAAIEAMSIVAFTALQNNDMVSMFIYGEGGMKYLPPQKGKRRIYSLLHESLQFQPNEDITSLEFVLSKLAQIQKRRSLVFVISDFLQSKFELELKRLTHRHELIPVVISDPMEARLPDIGLVLLRDPTTKEFFLCDSSQQFEKLAWEDAFLRRKNEQALLFRQAKTRPIYVSTRDDILAPLAEAFAKRSRHV